MITVREMKTSDWPAVSSIYSQAVLEGKATFQTECPDFETWDREHLAVCRYVIVQDDVIAGWCALSPTSGREVYRGVVEESIYVDTRRRLAGLGSRLLQTLCEESEKRGFWCLYASIFSFNLASIHIHKKMGFREIGYREKIAKDRFGVWQDTTLLERRSKQIL